MSISKLFAKVFSEDIFEGLGSEEISEENDETETVPTCSKAPTGMESNGSNSDEMTVSEQMALVKNWLEDRLNDIQNSYDSVLRVQQQERRQRLGPETTVFDIDFTTTVRAAPDRLSVRSQGNFNTIKANACVFGGRWMYEIQLHTKGVMQVGWASNKCMFNENSGVGDSKWSYGYDGSKQQSWHISTSKYGDKWQIGDIIGMTIDIENDKIEFYRNGQSMGVAFDRLEKGPGICFFPAVSLSYNQSIQANFGNMPFKYPIEGYNPIHAKPIVQVHKAYMLLEYLVNLAAIVSKSSVCKDKKPKTEKLSTRKTIYVVFSTLIIEKLSQVLFDFYVIEDVLMRTIMELCLPRETESTGIAMPGSPETTLGSLLSILWNYLENEEVKFVLKKLANSLLSSYSQTYMGLDQKKRRDVLYAFHCLCNHTKTRKYYIEYKLFKKHCLSFLLYVPPPEFGSLEQALPDSLVWTEGIGGPKLKYLQFVDKLSKSNERLYDLQKSLLLTLLTNTDGDMSSPSSRKIFIMKLRRYTLDLSFDQRPFQSFFLMQSSIHHPLDAQVALSLVCILTDVTKTLFELENTGKAVEVNLKYFLDGSFEYNHFDRVGGVVSHLRKVHRSEVIQQLGSERTQELLDDERTVVRVAELVDPSLFLRTSFGNLAGRTQTHGIGGISTFTHFINPRMTPMPDANPGNTDSASSLSELIDICILFYYCIGHKYVVKIASVREEIATLNELLKETKHYREDIEMKLKAIEDHAHVCMNETHGNICSELRLKFGQRENVFAKRSISLARKQTWLRAVALGKQRLSLLIWLLERDLRTLNAASRMGPLFSFVPEIYINILPILLDTVMDFGFHDLHAQYEISDAECAVNMAADFLSMHSADPRIILASCKDSMLQGLGTLTCHKAGIRALERTPKKCQQALVNSLLRPYENRAWGQSNWLLLRFWLGDGFAYRDARQPSIWQGGKQLVPLGLCRNRAKNETHTGLLHHIAPAYPSKTYQKLIATRLKEDEPFATIFLNAVLGQLNWAFSEFILLLQEIQNAAHRQENAVFEPKQLKICSMCFELTVSLLRCLEMIISIAPDIFQDSQRANSDLILNRVCQLISQVLSRVTVPPGCFQFVVDMCSADLNSVTHFPIITASLGILLALMRSEIETDKKPAKVTRVTRALLTDPSFQFANLEFALGEIMTPILQQNEIPRGNFDPQQRAHIDPLTNDVRVPMPATSKRIRADPPIFKFSLHDYPTHVSPSEIDDVRRLIEMLRMKQNLLSDITLPSEDSLCPICCAKPITVVFLPCKHQSCSNCILQHLMNSKVCFYCKAIIQTIESADGSIIYQNNDYPSTQCNVMQRT